jgi:hypothetical protein
VTLFDQSYEGSIEINKNLGRYRMKRKTYCGTLVYRDTMKEFDSPIIYTVHHQNRVSSSI